MMFLLDYNILVKKIHVEVAMQHQKAEVIKIFVGGPGDTNEYGLKVVETLRNKIQTDIGHRFSIIANNWKDEHNRFFLNIENQQASINERFDVRDADIVLMLFRGSLGEAKVVGSPEPSASAWELEQAAASGRARVIGIICLHFDNPPPPAPSREAQYEAHEAHRKLYETWIDKRKKYDELQKYIVEYCQKWSGRNRNINIIDDLKFGVDYAVSDLVKEILSQPVALPEEFICKREPDLNFEGAPYCGLFEFTFDLRDVYFGRSAEIADLVKKCCGPDGVRLLLVHGTSGVGKSSLVQAGFLKALENQHDPDFKLTYMVFEPAGGSRKPFRELAREVKEIVKNKIKACEDELGDELREIFVGIPTDETAVDKRIAAAEKFEQRIFTRLEYPARQEFLPIIINQLEKIYDVADEERSTFFNFLACSPYFQKIRLIGTIRQDAYDRLVQQEQHVNAALGEGQCGSYTLRPPLPRQLREMIVEPWRLKYGDPSAKFLDFVEEIMADALKAGEAALPLVSQTLFVLHNQHGENITRVTYEELGRLEGVVSKVAEAQQIDPLQLKILFKPLSTLKDGRWTRQVARKDAIVLNGVEGKLIEQLASVRVRLLHIGTGEGGHPVVQFAHEVLFTAWPELSQYTKDAYLLESERVAVIDDARKWEKGGRRPRDLKLRGEAYRRITGRLHVEPTLFDGEDCDVTERYLNEAHKFEQRERMVAAVNGGWMGEVVDIIRTGGMLRWDDRGTDLFQLRPEFWAAVTGNDYEDPVQHDWKTQVCPAPETQSIFVKNKKLVLSSAARGVSVAHIAAACGRLDLLKRLVTLNPDVMELRTDGGCGLVALAALGGDLPTVKYLVDELNLPIDEEDGDLNRPIIWAVQKAHKEVIAFLQQRGVRTEVMTQHGYNTLTEAARSGDVDSVREALNTGFHVDGQTEDGQTALMIAAGSGHIDVVRFLLSQKADPNLYTIYHLTALHAMSFQGKEESAIAELLIASGADRNARDNDKNTPLHWAAALGKVFNVRALLAQGVERDPLNTYGRTPLLDAATSGHAEVVRELLRGGAELGKTDPDGWTSLHFTASDGDQNTLHELLLHQPTGDIIDRRTRDGWTPLMLAAQKGHARIARRLITHGADRRLLLRDGKDALALAIKSLSVTTVREMLAPDPQPFAPSCPNMGSRPGTSTGSAPAMDIVNAGEHGSRLAPPFLTPDHLSLAASTNITEIVRVIIEAGGDLSRVDTLGDLPIHHAARLGLVDMVEWLIDHGSPIDSRNSDGVTPLECAEEYGQIEVVRWLQAKGAMIPQSWKHPKLTDTIRFFHFDSVGDDMSSRLLAHFAELDDLFVPLERAILRSTTLPFYHNTLLVAVEDAQRRGLCERFVLVHDSEGQTSCSVLDWTNEVIYSWNERYGLNLSTDDLAMRYCKFFFQFVCSNKGRFVIIEDVNDIPWTENATEDDVCRVAKNLINMHVLERTNDFVRIRMACLFRDGLFHTDAMFAFHECNINVSVNDTDDDPESETFSAGQGKLLNEELIEEKLPLQIPLRPGLFG